MNVQAYCFKCEKRVTALFVLPEGEFWSPIEKGSDIEVMHTAEEAMPSRIRFSMSCVRMGVIVRSATDSIKYFIKLMDCTLPPEVVLHPEKCVEYWPLSVSSTRQGRFCFV